MWRREFGRPAGGAVEGYLAYSWLAWPPWWAGNRSSPRWVPAIDAARQPATQVALIGGEPGIGKTRLVEELASLATDQGVEVLWSTAGGRDAPAFWPWSQALRSHLERVESVRLAAELGMGAAEVASLVPELRARLPALAVPTPEARDESRFLMFDAVTRFLVAAATHQPLAIVFDDLHDADRGSLRLLEFVARESRGAPLLLVATYRAPSTGSDPALGQTVAELARRPGATVIELNGLTAAEVGALVASVQGAEAPTATCQALHRRTGGNPFFVIELVRLLVARGELDDPRVSVAGRFEVPPSVRAIVLGRLSLVSGAVPGRPRHGLGDRADVYRRPPRRGL